MKIVIVGSAERNTDQDRADVYSLIDQLYERHVSAVFVTIYAKQGIAKFVKDKCGERDSKNEFKYQLAVCDIQLFSHSLPRQEASAIYTARNAMLFELGDVFYFFVVPGRVGIMEELLRARVLPAGRPYTVFLSGEKIEI